MKKVLLTVAYNGRAYHGYQLQEELPTVSLMLNRAVCAAFSVECNVTGCSRTDAGVHALGFCACVEPKNQEDEITVPIDKIPIAVNIKLPPDISVLEAREVSLDFHPRYDAVKKEYVYKIHASRVKNPFYEGLALEYGREISDTSLAKMRSAAQHFVGTHHFDAFMAQGSQIENTERTVFEAKVERNGDLVEFTVSANGFLYNMVRTIAGELLAIANGKKTQESLQKAYETGDRSLLGKTMPAKGLTLVDVDYGDALRF